jgi:predicted DNA-binding transcriptional regulator YafY
MLLVLQNRGRTTTRQLAEELEVARRTVLRDLDALTEAGLPIVVHRGNTGGVELGFNYRSRMVALDSEEAEALGVFLSLPMELLAPLAMETAARRACMKLVESFPEVVRARISQAQRRFRFTPVNTAVDDPRVGALGAAVRQSLVTRLRAKSGAPRTIHPVALEYGPGGWSVLDAQAPGRPIPIADWGDINISARSFRL